MDSEKDKPEDQPPKEETSAGEGQTTDNAQQAPADALSRTPDDLEEEAAKNPGPTATEPAEKKVSPFKKFFRKVNVYFLIFIILVVVAAAIAGVNYINSQKPPVDPDIAEQVLDDEALRQLANTDASVGSTSQTLTIKGNAIIDGQTLMRGNLNIAGNLQTGGSIQAPQLTISGAVNLGQTQVNDLQVATNVAIQGSTTMRDLSVAGSSTFSGPMTASQITVSRLILSGNAELQIPNHISFTGPSPSRTTNGGVLGNGGSASVSGSDTSGSINVNSGNNPAAGCFIRVNFNQAFSNMPKVTVTPIGSGAGILQFYVERDRNGFSVCTNNAAPANQAFGFDYFIAN